MCCLEIRCFNPIIRTQNPSFIPSLRKLIVYTELQYTWMFMQCIPPLAKPGVSVLSMSIKLTNPKRQMMMLPDYRQIISKASKVYPNYNQVSYGKAVSSKIFHFPGEERCEVQISTGVEEAGGSGEAKGWRRGQLGRKR